MRVTSHHTRLACRLIAISSLLLPVSSGCGSVQRFPNADPMLVEHDAEPFVGRPDNYFSGLIWDGADNSLFRPVSDFFAVDPARRAVNVNALDEVANSTWFTNRLGRASHDLTPERVALGPCEGAPPLDVNAEWTITGGKPNGENPGFFIKGQDGSRYLLKFDGAALTPRATAADVVGTRVYWAAGFNTPCNRIVLFDRKILKMKPGAMAESPGGQKEPMTDAMVDAAFERALRLPDGRYRANASLYLKGRPIGPFKYENTRDDDPNDVVEHEDRRELRGAGVLASWLNHFDSREQNSLDMWMKTGGGDTPETEVGYVKHHYIDFGDCFGSQWEWDSLSRRWGRSHFFGAEHIVADFFSLGLISRPWDKVEFGPSGTVFGYYDIEQFHPGDWFNLYPNPAFSRMQLDDAAWMARIIAGFTDAHVDALVETTKLQDPALAVELTRLLKGRRDKILKHWFGRLSPLAHPEVEGGRVCLRDIAAESDALPEGRRIYSSKAWVPDGSSYREVAATWKAGGFARPCVEIPDVGKGGYVVVEVRANSTGKPGMPAHVHLYQTGSESYRVVGLERRTRFERPDERP